MISKIDKNSERLKRHVRVRGKISGTPERPRLSVYRSLNSIYAQIIDDVAGKTLVSCSCIDKAMKKAVVGKTKKEQAKLIGEELAKRAKSAGITSVVFDRGGYLYIGRVQALAEGARAGGLEF